MPFFISNKGGENDMLRIGEVAKMTGVSVQSLRIWERQELIPKAKRSPTRHRLYTNDDVQAIKQFLEAKTNN